MSEHKLPAFQQYQLTFTAHIRDPKHAPVPPGVDAKRMAVYNELLYNNLESFLLACFPVSRKTLGKRLWGRIVRAFMRDHQCTTPFFRLIPEEFVKFLQGDARPKRLPDYLPYLAHYEWVELKLDVAPEPRREMINPKGDLLKQRPALNPVLDLLVYPYPVHRIGPKFKPTVDQQETTCLLVFRNLSDEVRFMEINSITAQLLDMLRIEPITGETALQRLAKDIRHPTPELVISSGLEILVDLQNQQAILGTYSY